MTDSAVDKNVPSVSDVENLFIKSQKLNRIDAYLRRFNPIKTMGMQHMEIRHSAILGWLLDPQESHGMGDQFLKAFLTAAMADDAGPHTPFRRLEISQADLMDAEVRREWRNIDLMVISPSNNWVFIVENKFHSKQHSDQLTRYYDLVEKQFGQNKEKGENGFDIHGIFLILHDEAPKDPRYKSIGYREVLTLLEQLVDHQTRPLASEINIFIHHYIGIIQEATDMDETKNKMVNLARQLYRDHRKVLDFVVQHGNGNDFSFAADKLFGENLNTFQVVKSFDREYVYHQTTATRLSFLPKTWFDAFGGRDYIWNGCENWWLELPVICWFELAPSNGKREAQLRLFAEIGPLSDHDFRKELIDGITATAAAKGLKRVSFQRTATEKGKKYSKFLSKNSKPITEVNDAEEIAAAMQGLLEDFQVIFDGLDDVMGQFMDHGVKKEQ